LGKAKGKTISKNEKEILLIMRNLRYRKVHLMCQIKGCHNTDSYAITLSRENGHSVVMCLDCMKKIGLLAAQIQSDIKAGYDSKSGELGKSHAPAAPETAESAETAEESEPINLETLTVAQLKELAKENGLRVLRTKAELVAEIRDYLAKEEAE
jgi:hypothetical protein